MLGSVPSATLLGVEGQVVTVEVHVSPGLPSYSVVGLPDTAVRESRERVRAAILSSQFSWPLKRITVNLAPAGVRKSGAGLELAVALGVLVAQGELPDSALDGIGVLGELGLDGSVRSVPGVLAMVDALRIFGAEVVIVPAADAIEAALVPGLIVRSARSLGELQLCLKGEEPWPEPQVRAIGAGVGPGSLYGGLEDEPSDLGEVRGLFEAREAIAVSAAGSHHLLLSGPPGVGKTMLARRMATILPTLSHNEAMEVTRIYSAAGHPPQGGLASRRPFRAPHHTISIAGLVGGGSGRPRPGEITMAHQGVLFLDELGEFAPSGLDALRQPLEDRVARIVRQPVSLTFPAAFVLVACTNPCPCGLGGPLCQCSETHKARYARRLSAPLLDRFDLRVVVQKPGPDAARGESSQIVRERVQAAVDRQELRLAGTPWGRNAHVPAGALDTFIVLDESAQEMLMQVTTTRDLTARGTTRVRRVARTIADLDDSAAITPVHIYRASDLRGDQS